MEEGLPKAPRGTVHMHNVRFYKIVPQEIVAMSFNKQLRCLALIRGDSAIELWDLAHAAYLDRVIHLPADLQLESLQWARKRLFSVGLTGKLIEWDLQALRPRRELSPTGNALWCLDVNHANTEIAVGSEEGHINILSLENDEVSYKSIFHKQDGRVLCCKFDWTDKRLITGSVGAVRVWDVDRGNTLFTMTLSERTAVVHCVLALRNNTIIAGDSTGSVTVWSNENGTQLETRKVLDKHLLALAINGKEDRLVCSGKIPVVRVLTKTLIKREDSTYMRWIKFLQHEPHSHYVRSIVIMGAWAVSGGRDGLLCFSSLTKATTVTKHAPFLKGPCVGLAPKANLLLLRYAQSLHLWRLGLPRPTEYAKLAVGDQRFLEMMKRPQKLLQLDVADTKFIQASAISPDNDWICYSTLDELRLSRLQLDPLAVLRLQGGPEELQPASFIHFSRDNQLFLLNAAHPELRCFALDELEVRFLYSVDLSAQINSSINHVKLSACSKYLVVAASNHQIAVWQLDGQKSKHLLNLPRYRVAGVTALALHENKAGLVVAYADARIVEYDLKRMCFVSTTQGLFVVNDRRQPIRGMLLDASNESIVIVYNEEFIYVLESYRSYRDQYQDQINVSEAKRTGNIIRKNNSMKKFRLKMQLSRPVSHREIERERERIIQFSCAAFSLFQHFVEVLRLSASELVTVGIEGRHLVAALPGAYRRKKFGKS
ncbi:hypothetical protein KR222_003616 [Zaprionus bogoriensis]|nr:hypothetical protein KR222_003616 [Zaprionus bogoriensis]